MGLRMPDLPGRRWIAALLILVGGNALVAAVLFVARPDGSALGIPQDWLEGSPFDSYLVPGFLLGGLGLLSWGAAVAQLRRHPLAWAWSGAAAVGFGVWILVQAYSMGSFRHPAQTVLQAFVLGIAIALGVLSLRQMQIWRRPPQGR